MYSLSCKWCEVLWENRNIVVHNFFNQHHEKEDLYIEKCYKREHINMSARWSKKKPCLSIAWTWLVFNLAWASSIWSFSSKEFVTSWFVHLSWSIQKLGVQHQLLYLFHESVLVEMENCDFASPMKLVEEWFIDKSSSFMYRRSFVTF